MSRGIWFLRYSIDDTDRDRYLDWFHRIHVGEKLARPGYTWAAHYRVVEQGMNTTAPRYLAAFGGDTPRVFLDPSPTQLKTRQNDATREMMGLRIDGRSAVYCEEWQTDPPHVDTTIQGDVTSPVIAVEGFDACGHDEDFAAWCAQEHMLHFAASSGCRLSRKLIASAGMPRHLLLHEFDTVASARDAFSNEPTSPWRQQILTQSKQPLGNAIIAERIWPRG